jgi:hypothetical protein
MKSSMAWSSRSNWRSLESRDSLGIEGQDKALAQQTGVGAVPTLCPKGVTW